MNRVDVWNDLGNIYLKANDMNAAIDAYQKAIDQGDVNSEVYKNLAAAYFNQGNIRDSIPLYQKSIELLSDLSEKAIVYTCLGDCYRRVEDFDNAIASFKSAIELQPGNPELCVGLGEVQRDLEKIFGFEQITKENENILPSAGQLTDSLPSDGIVFDPDLQAPISGGLAMANRKNGSGFSNQLPAGLISESITISDELVSSAAAEKNQGTPIVFTPTSEHASELLSTIASDFIPVNLDTNLDDSEEIESSKINSGEKLESEHGVRLTLLLTLGIMQYRNSNLEEADSILQSAINASVEIGNTWFEALAWHAIALVKTALGELESAIHAYLRAVELAPDQIFPWNNLGSLYETTGENEKALEAYQKAIKINPDDATSWDGMGDVYTKMCRFDEAIAAYQLANVFERKPKGEDAIKNYEKAFEFYNYTLASFENAKKTILKAAETFQAENSDPAVSAGITLQLDLENDTIPVIEITQGSAEEAIELNKESISEKIPGETISQNETECLVEITDLPENNADSGLPALKMQVLTDMLDHQPVLVEITDEFNDRLHIEDGNTFEIDDGPQNASEGAGQTAVLENSLTAESSTEAEIEKYEESSAKAILETDAPAIFEAAIISDEFDTQAEIIDDDCLEPFENEIDLPDLTDSMTVLYQEQDVEEVNVNNLNDTAELDAYPVCLPADVFEVIEKQENCETETNAETKVNIFSEMENTDQQAVIETEAEITVSETEILVEEKVFDVQTPETRFEVESSETDLLQAVNETAAISDENQEEEKFIEEMAQEVTGDMENVIPEDQVFERTAADEVHPSDEMMEQILAAPSAETTIVDNAKTEEAQPVEEILPPVIIIEEVPVAARFDTEITIASYEAVVKQNPKNDRAWVKLGAAYKSSNRFADAVSAFEKAAALKPRNHVYHYELGSALAGSGDLESAVAEIEKVLEIDPTFMAAHCTLAGYFRKLNNESEFNKHIEAAELSMCKEKEYDRACFESIRGNVDSAVELLTAAIQKKQTTVEAIRADHDLDFIRDDQKYLDFIEQYSD